MAAIRVNETAFNFTVEVVYTGAGGGGLTLTDITFREKETEEWFMHTSEVELHSASTSNMFYAVIVNSQFAGISDVEFSLTTRNRMNHGIPTMLMQRLRKYYPHNSFCFNDTLPNIYAVAPGPPDNIRAITTTSHSLRMRAHLSTIGTAPIYSVHFVVIGPDEVPVIHNLTEGLMVGSAVEIGVGQLSPETSYRVVVYAINAAGKGQDSESETFRTRKHNGNINHVNYHSQSSFLQFLKLQCYHCGLFWSLLLWVHWFW